ncbi:putative phage tail protein [Metabacillus fastidiosus]|uniref:putative phage tail protein n=1 Tax=Metabacillus fastidiosus TaxID=1458 RepID=UPI003D287355
MDNSERYERLIEYLPEVYARSPEMQGILKGEAPLLDQFEKALEDVFNQAFVETATWGLEKREKELNLPYDPNLSYEHRRQRILMKENSIKAATIKNLRDLANIFSEPKTVEVLTILNEYAFRTKYNLDHLINYKDMVIAIEEMKPAHMEHVVGLNVTDDLIIEDTVTYKMKTYHKVHEFKVGMTPIKHVEGGVLP